MLAGHTSTLESSSSCASFFCFALCLNHLSFWYADIFLPEICIILNYLPLFVRDQAAHAHQICPYLIWLYDVNQEVIAVTVLFHDGCMCPPLLVSMVMSLSGSIHAGTSYCSGSFQSSSAEEPSSKWTSIFSLSPMLVVIILISGAPLVHLPCRFHYLSGILARPCFQTRTNPVVTEQEASDFKNFLCSSGKTNPAGVSLLS